MFRDKEPRRRDLKHFRNKVQYHSLNFSSFPITSVHLSVNTSSLLAVLTTIQYITHRNEHLRQTVQAVYECNNYQSHST